MHFSYLFLRVYVNYMYGLCCDFCFYLVFSCLQNLFIILLVANMVYTQVFGEDCGLITWISHMFTISFMAFTWVEQWIPLSLVYSLGPVFLVHVSIHLYSIKINKLLFASPLSCACIHLGHAARYDTYFNTQFNIF